MSSVRKKFLLLFANDLVEFRYPEIESLLKVFNIAAELPRVEPVEQPFWILENVNENDIKNIASRSVSLKFAMEVWTSGRTLEEFHENARSYVKQIDKKYQTQSFKFLVESFNKHLKLPQRIEKIESMQYLDTTFGPIDLVNPDNKFVYFEYHGLKNNLPELTEIFLGEWIADGQRDLIKTISLKDRKFIGNTSMEATLSLLMANQGLCKENELMLDPFCGTGSMLISGALFGSYVMGCDIDFLTLHAKSKPVRVWMKVRDSDESIRANMQQYNLQNKYLDVFVGDFSKCPLHGNLTFDAIICDPPYGVRESMSKIEKKEKRMKCTAMTEDAIHYPSLTNYTTKDMYNDLLSFSVKRLKMGGRLVLWFPIPDKSYEVEIFPQHTALKLVAHSKQQLISETSRVLLTYEKISDEGEVVETKSVEFREKYFKYFEEKRDRKEEFKQNLVEAEKRGKKILSRTEWKQHANKKLHKDDGTK